MLIVLHDWWWRNTKIKQWSFIGHLATNYDAGKRDKPWRRQFAGRHTCSQLCTGVYVPRGLTLIPLSHCYNPNDFDDSGGISRGYLVQPPAHSRACLKDAADLEARTHRSAFLQCFSNYRVEEGGRWEAIPNPAIKLLGLPSSPFTTLEGMWWNTRAAQAVSWRVAACAVSAA